MDTIKLADGTILENVLVGMSRGILSIHSIKLPIKQAIDYFLDETKTSKITVTNRDEEYSGYTRLVGLTNQGSLSIKMMQEE